MGRMRFLPNGSSYLCHPCSYLGLSGLLKNSLKVRRSLGESAECVPRSTRRQLMSSPLRLPEVVGVGVRLGEGVVTVAIVL